MPNEETSRGHSASPATAPAWAEDAILAAVAVGASDAHVAARLAGASADSAGHILALIADLERRGLLRARSGTSGAAHELTELGRQAVLDRLDRRAEEASALEAERQQVDRLRTDLLSTISHELRTPLTLIRTSIGLLLDSEPDEEMRLRLLRNIKQSTDRMNALVTDLLDLARLRGDRFDLHVRAVDLAALISGAVSLMRPLLDAKEQRVDLSLLPRSPTVPGDYRRLERVLLNLLGNANKFAPTGTTIAIAVQDTEHEAIVAVRDQGPGIAPDAMPHLFDQFFTARTSSSRHSIGAGLGLPIAQGIVEAHGGRIWVESALGRGTTVSFTLPKSWPEESRNEGPGR
jgi:signal transduction histidine kinase